MRRLSGQPTIVGPGLFLLAITTIAAVPVMALGQPADRQARCDGYFAADHRCSSTPALTPLLHPGQGWIYVGLLAIMGATSSGFITLPLGMIGDIIDFDTLIHRQPRGGIYWGVWSFAQKVAPALAIGVTLPFLQWLGFHPGGHNTQAALECAEIRLLLRPRAVLCRRRGHCCSGIPLDAHRHDIIRKRSGCTGAKARAIGRAKCAGAERRLGLKVRRDCATA